VTTRPRVLFAHERPGVGRAVSRVLDRAGFTTVCTLEGTETLAALGRERWAALVVDVALPGIPGYELVDRAHAMAAAAPAQGAPIVVLVASVYRPTAYKRRPTGLYGADDYVEIHHLGDLLPAKLCERLGLSPWVPQPETLDAAAAALRDEGDERMHDHDAHGLAKLIVADVVLYNGDAILEAGSFAGAERAVADDLAIARDLFAQVLRAESRRVPMGDPIGAAFAELMAALGRTAGGEA
jgi:CheY-like chemotaxis protein